MLTIIMFIIIKVLPALVALFFLLRLIDVQGHPEKLHALLAKHKQGTPAHKMYRQVYSQRFLKGWVCIALWFVIDLLYTTYKLNYNPSGLLLSAVLISSLALAVIGFIFTASAFKTVDKE